MRLDEILPDRLREGLTPAERRLLERVADGEEADFSAPDEGQNDPTQGAAWGPERTIRAAFLHWLCTDAQAAACVPPKGIRIRGARIEGPLDFEGARLLHRLSLIRCAIPEGILLTDARARRIDLSSSYIRGLHADGLGAEGDLVLSGLICAGEVRLLKARILGELSCRGARLENPNGNALSAAGMTVEGNVFLDEGFHATGAVRLRGARIQVQLSCRGARLENPNGDALVANRMTVGGSVFLDRGFHATGAVRLPGVRIQGQLSCRGARLENPNGDALVADRMTVEGDVFLNRGFHATGAVRLVGARIRGALACTNARLENPNGDALVADRMTVEGDVFLDRGFHATGAVRLVGARVGGRLSCTGARLENSNGNALNADEMTVEGSVFLDQKFYAIGTVRLARARIRDQLRCTDAQFESPNNREALNAPQLIVEGSVFLNRGFSATGEVRLPGARIQGALVCTEARFENPNGIALNLEHARLGVIEDDEGSWPQRGRLRIDGLEYEGFAGDQTPTDARRRLEWLRRQLPDFRPQPYDQLARVFRRMGREADAVEVLIAKQEDLIRHGKLSWWGRLTRRILGVTIGHGYRSGRALLWSLAFVIAGALIFGWANARGLMAPSSPEILTDPLYRAGGTIPPDYPRFQALAYSLDAFLPIVDLHQESFWLPDAGKPFGALVRIYLWIHIAAGWFLSTLFVSGVTGLVRRLE
jgi:hypothetical protein